MRVGQTHAPEVRGRVGLDPDHIVERPEVQVHQDLPDAVDVVVAPDDPERAIVLEHAPASGEPGGGEPIVGLEAAELVPLVIHGVHPRHVRAPEVLRQLEIVGRVGENEVHALLREPRHRLDAVTLNDCVNRHVLWHCFLRQPECSGTRVP